MLAISATTAALAKQAAATATADAAYERRALAKAELEAKVGETAWKEMRFAEAERFVSEEVLGNKEMGQVRSIDQCTTYSYRYTSPRYA